MTLERAQTPKKTQAQTTIDKSTKENVLPPLLDQQINKIARDLPANYARNLRALDNQKNIATIVNYVNAIEIETNVSEHYRRENIDVLRRFSKFNHEKDFTKLTRDDVVAFLESYV